MKYDPFMYSVYNFPLESKMKCNYRIISFNGNSYIWYKLIVNIGGWKEWK